MISDDILQFIRENSPYNTITPKIYEITIDGQLQKVTIRRVWIALLYYIDKLYVVAVYHTNLGTTAMYCLYGMKPEIIYADENQTEVVSVNLNRTPYFEDLSICILDDWEDPVLEVLKSFNTVDFHDSQGLALLSNHYLMIRLIVKTLDGGDFSFLYHQKYKVPPSIQKLGDVIAKTILKIQEASSNNTSE